MDVFPPKDIYKNVCRSGGKKVQNKFWGSILKQVARDNTDNPDLSIVWIDPDDFPLVSGSDWGPVLGHLHSLVFVFSVRPGCTKEDVK